MGVALVRNGLILLLAAALPLGANDADASRAAEILHASCAQCHSATTAMSGLDVGARDGLVKGGSRGPAIVPGDAAASVLIQAVERQGKLAMPPVAPLAAEDVAVLKRWIDAGAPWSETAGREAPQSSWWAFQPVERPAVPVSGKDPGENAVDAFILRKLQAASLAPAEPAPRAVLARRAYFDLWGLPPSREQVDAFVRDQSPEAWSKLVDELLASPHYGEKWGRHWLDLVRYSDTAGFELDSYIHDAWRYRDWVIDSFNEDKPYDRFIREQIAADELYPEDPVARTGTGFYCVGPNRDLFPDQADINREETLTDWVDTTSAVFLGLTAGCARCHDHKFDPISQEDYYRVRAVFAPAVKVKVPLDRLTSLGFDVRESVNEWKLREIGEQIRDLQRRCQNQVRDDKLSEIPPEAAEALGLSDDERTQRQRELATEFGDAARVSDDEVRACMTPQEAADLHEIEKTLVNLYSGYRAKPFACGIADWWNVSPRTFLPARGSRPEREVEPGFFSILGGGDVPPPAEHREATGPIPLTPTTGRRTALANWIAAPDNPLTARVMVNRIWQYHFGRGLIETPSDFGTRSGEATHPELLDWLAADLVDSGWSIKHIHRLILESETYRRAANPSEKAHAEDPANRLLSHFSRRRLNADEVRDAVLLATGALNPERGGRPVVPPLSEEEKAMLTQRPSDAWVLTADESQHDRRSVYLIQKRTFRMPMMEVFDAPESMLTCPRRESSTTAPQALTLFNGTLTMERSREMASKLLSSNPDDGELIAEAWSRILAREPAAEERARAEAFLAAGASREVAAAELLRALLNTNEFLYVD